MSLKLIACIAAAAAGVSCSAVTQSLVKRSIPAFPELPEPVESLSAGQSGLVYFKSSTPFDLDVLLEGPEYSTPSNGVGMPFLPAAAA